MLMFMRTMGLLAKCADQPVLNLAHLTAGRLTVPWNLQPSPMKRKENDLNQTSMITLLGTNISPEKSILKMICLFPKDPRSLEVKNNPFKGSLNYPKKVTLNHQVDGFRMF